MMLAVPSFITDVEQICAYNVFLDIFRCVTVVCAYIYVI